MSNEPQEFAVDLNVERITLCKTNLENATQDLFHLRPWQTKILVRVDSSNVVH